MTSRSILCQSYDSLPYETEITLAGAMSWGQKLVDSSGNVLYETSDGYQFDPNSPTAEMFRSFAPIFEHPTPNAANTRSRII